MPERLRLDNYKPTPLKPVEMKPPSPSTELLLAPLKIAKAKQSPVPVNAKTQHSSPTTGSPREAGTPDNNDIYWARKGKVKADTLTLNTVRFVSS